MEETSERIGAELAVVTAEERLAAATAAFNTQGARSEEGIALAAITTPRTGSVPEDSEDMVFTEEEVEAAENVEEEATTSNAPTTPVDTSSPPAVFQELSNQALYQDYLVFINGINVTRWVVGSVTYSIAGRGGTNNAAFQLANPDNLFVLIPNEEAGGSEGGNIPPPTGGDVDPTSLHWRTAETNTIQTDHPMYSEIVKKETYLRKALSPLQIEETIGVTDRAAGNADRTAGNAVQVTRPGGNPREEAGFDIPNMERWPFGYHRVVFHKHDPVRIFIHNPFTPDPDSWICAFTGYIQNYPVDDDWVMGNSTLNISCYCIKALMQKMRFQTNQILYELPGDVAVDEGFFSDFLRASEGGEALHRLANQTYENIASYIITGRMLSEWFEGYQDTGNTNYVLGSSTLMRERFSSIGLPTVFQEANGMVPSVEDSFDNPTTSTDSNDRIERTTNGVGQMSMGSVFRFPGPLCSDAEKSNFIGEWHKLSLFGGFRRPLTYQEALHLGSETKIDGEFPPDRSNVHMLMPSSGSGQGTLEQIGIDDNTQEGRREFATRYDMMDGYSEKIDFQWWTNGLGNIMVEMPMYDWFPSDFGEWESVFTVDKHTISSNIGDESGDPPTAVIARGDTTGHVNVSGQELDTWTPQLGIAWAPTMIHRYGVTTAEINLPFITDQAILRARALLELQKRLAEANQLSVDFICRPLLTPNRPLYFKARERLGWIQSISNTLAVLGECTTNADLNYTRHRDISGHWRHITGGSFSSLRYGQVVTGDDCASGGGEGLVAGSTDNLFGASAGTADNAENFPVTCNNAIQYATPNRGENNCEARPNSPSVRAEAPDDPTPSEAPRASDAEQPEAPEEADKLCIYITGDSVAFITGARDIAANLSADRESFESAADIRTILERRPDNTLSQLLLFAHGSPQWWGQGRNEGAGHARGTGVSLYYRRDFFPEVMKLSTFINIAGPKLVDNAIISLCACSCGRNPNSRRTDDNDRRLNGGTHSFAALLRDGMAQAGKPVQVRAHTTPGHATANANTRYFTSTRGSEGISVGEETWGSDVILYRRRLVVDDKRYTNGNNAWAKGRQQINGRWVEAGMFWGEPAIRWISGGPVDQSVIDARPSLS